MLKKYTLRNTEAFGDEVILDNLNKINFIYGPNGSGKTTLSNSFRFAKDENCDWTPGDNFKILVYNRNFVEEILRESNQLPGIFVLGEENVEKQKRLDEINKPNGELSKVKDAISRHYSSIQQLKSTLENEKNKFYNIMWGFKNLEHYNDELSPTFEGYNGSKKKFAEKCIEIYHEDTEYESIDKIIEQSKALLGTKALKDKIDLLPYFELDSANRNLLEESISIEISNSFSKYIEEKSLTHWVLPGLEKISDDICPFCQQKITPEIKEFLQNLINDSFSENQSKINIIKDRFSSYHEFLKNRFEFFPDSLFNDELSFTSANESLQNYINDINELLNSKYQNMALSTPLPTPTIITKINQLIESFNQDVDEYNNLVKTRADKREVFLKQSWKYFVDQYCVENIKNYLTSVKGMNRGLSKLEDNLSKSNEKQSALEN